METLILGQIAQLSGLSANLIEVDCRATHCRLQLTLPAALAASQPELTTLSEDGPAFVLAEELGLDTELVLATRNAAGQHVFLTYLGRPDESRTQSVSPRGSSA